MKKLLLSLFVLYAFSITTSCNQEKKINGDKEEATTSPEQVVLEYQKWNLENECTITSTTDRTTFHTTLENVREWLIKLELTGFFSDFYLENKKKYYKDLEYYFNNGGDDPDFVLHTDIELSFDNIPYSYKSGMPNKILIKNVIIKDERATMEVFRYFITSNLNRKDKEVQFVTEKDDFEMDDKLWIGENNFVITLIKENEKWLIDSATRIRK